MRLLTVLASSAVLSIGLLALTAGDARADEALPAPAPPPAAAATATANEKPQPKDDADEIKHLSLAVNPLGIAIGRYSVTAEYMIAKHHGLSLSPFYTSVPITATTGGKEVDLGSLSGFGGELGYRFYTGSRGANGFFVGPSALFASYSSSAPGGASGQSFTALGGAVDIGGQAIIGPGVVVGAGAGLQYTSNSEELTTDGLNLGSAIIAGGGVRPRFLLAVGYAF